LARLGFSVGSKSQQAARFKSKRDCGEPNTCGVPAFQGSGEGKRNEPYLKYRVVTSIGKKGGKRQSSMAGKRGGKEGVPEKLIVLEGREGTSGRTRSF